MSGTPTPTEQLCPVCSTPVPAQHTGRPSRYCSSACRQRAYRARRRSATKLDLVEQGAAAAGGPAGPLADAGGGERRVPQLSGHEMLAWRGLLEVQSRLVRLLDEDLQRQAGLTVNEFDLLFQLWLAPRQRLRMKHLAVAVLVTPSGITRMVSRLQERGLVERINTAGRQAVETALTEAGIDRLHQAMDYHFGEVRRLFVDNLSATDIAQLAAIWQRLHHALPAPPSTDLEGPRS